VKVRRERKGRRKEKKKEKKKPTPNTGLLDLSS
jgi:hypothetical protein